jgi:site-specific recombinase XerD
MDKNLAVKIKSLENETLKNIRLSKAQNTLRAYKSDFQDFIGFCNINNLISLPAEPKTVSLYITHLSKTSKTSTLKRRLVSISTIHKAKGFYIDIKHPLIVENFYGIKRVKGSYQKSKKPVLLEDLKKILNSIDSLNQNVKKKLRDKTILSLGFCGGFRRSELVDLTFKDIEFVKEGVKIFIKKSKSDQSGEGMTKAIPYFENKTFCPVNLLSEWININNIKDENEKIFNLSDKMVSLILKKYLKILGYDPLPYSGHSLRSGFATTAADKGADERSIMNITGHKSVQMVRRYIKETNLFKNNPLNKIDL